MAEIDKEFRLKNRALTGGLVALEMELFYNETLRPFSLQPFQIFQYMSTAKVKGIVHVIEETKTYGAKGFRKRLVVLEDDSGRFTNYIPVDFIQDDCDTVDDMKIGDEVEITYRLAGRKWQKDPNSDVKFFLNAEAIGFKVMDGTTGSSGVEADTDPNSSFAEAAAQDEDDIPF